MPLLDHGGVTIDYLDEGSGEAVVLVHSSVSGNRQWKALSAALSDRYRVLAHNMFGYGETTPWPTGKPQALVDQAALALALCADLAAPIHVVGHSYGGTVALELAVALGPRLGRLALFEPTAFHLLKQGGRDEAWGEACALRDYIREFGTAGDWPRVAERFSSYWVGEGSWAAMPDKRRASFLAAMPPNLNEWDSVNGDGVTVEEWARLPQVLVMRSHDTRRSVREIYDVFHAACPHWSFAEVPEGGHMAPLTRPELVNPLIRRFVDTGRL